MLFNRHCVVRKAKEKRAVVEMGKRVGAVHVLVEGHPSVHPARVKGVVVSGLSLCLLCFSLFFTVICFSTWAVYVRPLLFFD